MWLDALCGGAGKGPERSPEGSGLLPPFSGLPSHPAAESEFDQKVYRSMKPEILTSVDQVKPRELDELAIDPIYTWGWLKTLEEMDGLDISPRHLVIRDEKGLAAFAPCFLENRVVFDDLRDELLLGWQRRALAQAERFGLKGLRLAPALMMGVPECFSSKVLVAKRLAPRYESLMKVLLSALEDQAREDDVGVFGFMGVMESDKGLMEVLPRCGFHRLLRTATSILDIEWGSYEDYLRSLPRNRRKSLRSQERQPSKYGFSIRRMHHFGPYAKRLSDLAKNVYDRHSNGPNPFTESFYRNLQRNMGRKAYAFVAKRNGDIAAYIMTLAHKSVIRGHQWGTDYSQESRKGQLYFNLAYTATIMDAIESGAGLIDYGPAAWREKAKYGCRFERTFLFLKGRSRATQALLGLLLRRVNRSKERWIERKLSGATKMNPRPR